MSIRGSSALAHLSVVEGSDDPWPVSPDTPPAEEPDWHSLFEGERARAESEGARADAGEARVQELLNDIRRLRAALRKAGADEGASGPQPRIPRRLLKARESSQHQNDTIGSLRMENAELRKEVAAQRKAAQAARTSLSRKDTRLLNARESSQAQRDTIKEAAPAGPFPGKAGRPAEPRTGGGGRPQAGHPRALRREHGTPCRTQGVA